MAKSIGRYEIREELGRGGMAAVYLANDTRLDRDVALKLLDQNLTSDAAFTARFEREAKTVAALEHSAIVSLYDFGEADGWLYLVMRYMKGGSLKEQLAPGPLTIQEAYNVVRRIGAALDKAHSLGIIHRDLKPGNILLDDEGQSYLSDFGIVKVAKGDEENLTETGRTLGTFAYMSPEQLLGKDLDGRSDIYALGIVLYEMLTGRHPYGTGETTSAAMIIAHTQEPVPDITRDKPDLPPAFTAVIQKALAKDPAERFATGAEMAAAMQAAMAGKPASAETAAAAPAVVTAQAAPAERIATTGRPAATEKRQIPMWVLAIIGLIIIGVVGVVGIGLAIGLSAGGFAALPFVPPSISPTTTTVPTAGATATVTVLPTRAEGAATATALELIPTLEVTNMPSPTQAPPTQTPPATGIPGPVTISFQEGVWPDESYDGVSDAFISEMWRDLNFGGDAGCLIDGDEPSGSGTDMISLLRWDIGQIPTGSQITAAAITLLISNATVETYQLYELKRPWVEDDVTWNIAGSDSSWEAPGAKGRQDRDRTWLGTLAPVEIGPYEVDLNDAALAVIQQWVDDPSSNHGFIIADPGSLDGLDFHCGEYIIATSRPMLTITYESSGQ